MRVALITDGGFPFARRNGGAWCERLVRGLACHEFEVFALRPGGSGRCPPPLPPNVTGVRVLPPLPDAARPGRAARRGTVALECYRELVRVLVEGAGLPDRGPRDAGEAAVGAALFAAPLYGLAEAARGGRTPPHGLPRSEAALRALDDACRAPGVRPPLGAIGVRDLLTVADLLARALHPLFAPWYGPRALGAADLCHVTSAGPAVLPGLLAKRFFGMPLLITEYGARLRETLLAQRAAGHSPQVRALLTAFHRLLAQLAYREADAITPGDSHTRRWQALCGADRDRIRTVHQGYPGLADRPVPPPASALPDGGGPPTLLWTGRPEPAKDLVGLLHAFARVRTTEPGAGARLRVVQHGAGDPGYLAHCRQLAAHLFPDEAPSAVSVGENPVSFESGTPGGRGGDGCGGAVGFADTRGTAGMAGVADVVVLSSTVEGFPHGLVEAMFAQRATVSTDVGAVREVIGGTGLVVPPRNPRALADACTALLADPARRDRLGAAARERALRLFTVEQNVRAFRELYLDLRLDAAAVPGPATAADTAGDPPPARTAGAVPGLRTGGAGAVPGWARIREDPA